MSAPLDPQRHAYGCDRRDFLVRSLRTAAGFGFAALLPLSCANDRNARGALRGRIAGSDDEYMLVAIELARRDFIPFGAILVHQPSGQIVGVGRNQSHQNPARHAEVEAIEDYLALMEEDRLSTLGLSGNRGEALRALSETVLYSTAEPCPMCMSAIVWARIPKVVYGASIPYLISQRWRQIDIRAVEVAMAETSGEAPEVIGGVMREEAELLYERWIPESVDSDPARER